MKKKLVVKIECVLYSVPPGSKIKPKPSQKELKQVLAKEIADRVLDRGNVINLRQDDFENRIMAELKRVKI